MVAMIQASQFYESFLHIIDVFRTLLFFAVQYGLVIRRHEMCYSWAQQEY